MEITPLLKRGTLIAVIAPGTVSEVGSELIAALALRGPVTVLDAGNRCTPYRIVGHLYRKTPSVETVVKTIFIRRAFTCHQVLELFANIPPLNYPCVVLDMLATFYDEQIPDHEIKKCFDNCLQHLNRTCLPAPMVMILNAPLNPSRAFILENLCNRADHVLRLETPITPILQPALF
jgi:hypothetical protein